MTTKVELEETLKNTAQELEDLRTITRDFITAMFSETELPDLTDTENEKAIKLCRELGIDPFGDRIYNAVIKLTPNDNTDSFLIHETLDSYGAEYTTKELLDTFGDEIKIEIQDVEYV